MSLLVHWLHRSRVEKLLHHPGFDHKGLIRDTQCAPAASIPYGPERAFLEADICALAGRLGALLERKHIHASLSIQRTDGCRKIHTDYVSLRLLCTYAGPGTEWVPNADLVRENLGRTDVDVDAANRSVIRRGAVLRSCAPGELLLLKGEAYPGNSSWGAAHRSPPIEARGESRLVLKLDEHPCGC